MLELVYNWSPAREFSGRCMLQDLWAKSASVTAQQCILCSPDPSDQSYTADLSPFSFFLYPQHAPFPLPPPPVHLPPCSPSLLSLLSALSLLIMFWCSCCQRQHSQGTAPWETCKSVSLSTLFSFPFQPFIFIRQVNMSANYLLYSLYCISVGCVNNWNWINRLVVDLAVKWDKNTFIIGFLNSKTWP